MRVHRGWHMEVCVCKGLGFGRLLSQQRFKANIANGADRPAA